MYVCMYVCMYVSIDCHLDELINFVPCDDISLLFAIFFLKKATTCGLIFVFILISKVCGTLQLSGLRPGYIQG